MLQTEDAGDLIRCVNLDNVATAWSRRVSATNAWGELPVIYSNGLTDSHYGSLRQSSEIDMQT